MVSSVLVVCPSCCTVYVRIPMGRIHGQFVRTIEGDEHGTGCGHRGKARRDAPVRKWRCHFLNHVGICIRFKILQATAHAPRTNEMNPVLIFGGCALLFSVLKPPGRMLVEMFILEARQLISRLFLLPPSCTRLAYPPN